MQYRGLTLDRFQAEAIEHLQQGRSVLVCAPTGTGKTVIADWIVERALSEGRDVVYTAPVKALSNQKYRDYPRLHGHEAVGLVTGDLVINHGGACRAGVPQGLPIARGEDRTRWPGPLPGPREIGGPASGAACPHRSLWFSTPVRQDGAPISDRYRWP